MALELIIVTIILFLLWAAFELGILDRLHKKIDSNVRIVSRKDGTILQSSKHGLIHISKAERMADMLIPHSKEHGGPINEDISKAEFVDREGALVGDKSGGLIRSFDPKDMSMDARDLQIQNLKDRMDFMVAEKQAQDRDFERVSATRKQYVNDVFKMVGAAKKEISPKYPTIPGKGFPKIYSGEGED